MRRSGAVDAKIVGGRDNPNPKPSLPQAIGRHAAGERVVACQQPLGEPRFGLGIAWIEGMPSGRFQHTGRTRADGGKRRVGLAPPQNGDRRRLVRLPPDARKARQRRGKGFIQPLQFRDQPFAFLAVRILHQLANPLHLVLDAVRLGCPAASFFRGRERHVVLVSRGQVRLQPVIVFLKKRIELVVVAPRAADCQSEKHAAHGVGHFRQHFVAAERHIAIARVPPDRPQTVKPHGDQRGRVALRRITVG